MCLNRCRAPCLSATYKSNVNEFIPVNVSGQSKVPFPLRLKTICVGSWRWLTPPMPQFCIGYTNKLVSKNAKICVTPNTKHKICVTSNTKPQCDPMEYRLRWVPNAKFLHRQLTFVFLDVKFIRVGFRFFSEIWA